MTGPRTPGGLRYRVVRPPSVSEELDDWLREHAPQHTGAGRDPREEFTPVDPEDDDRD